MESIKTLYLTGYRGYEMGVFQDTDPKIEIIKKNIKIELTGFLNEGLEWVLVSGQLGVELWGAQVVHELQTDYPELKLAVILPFKNYGNNWNEKNQAALLKVQQMADYVNSTSHKEYESPQQLRNHTRFLLEHSGGTLMVYDEEYQGKSQYFLKEAKAFQNRYPYEIRLITFDDLQSFIENSYDF